MAEDIKKEARLRQINCITLARELKECSVREFVLIFGMIATNCNGRELVIPPAKPSTYKFVLEGVCLQDLIHRYFGLSPDVIWANIHSKAKAEKIRVEEFADYLHQEMPSIVVWAFDQTIEILRKR
jgi:hypothetical protein